jgi:HK97 family phage prohead protease
MPLPFREACRRRCFRSSGGTFIVLDDREGFKMDHLTCGLEVKLASGDAADMTFSGYGAVFGNVDAWGDTILKGAFKDTLAEARKSGNWPAMLMQHGGFGADDMTPVGIWTGLSEDDTGLKVDGKLADTARGREAYALLKMQPRPAITGLSIGYRTKEFSIGTKPGEPKRSLKKVDLLEISLVTFPANPLARVGSVKSDLTKRDAERALRDAGFSREEAKAIVADGYKGLSLRDAGNGLSDVADQLRRNIETLRT